MFIISKHRHIKFYNVKYKCCGLNDFKDYAHATLPASCYLNPKEIISPKSELYQSGCKNSIMKYGKRIVWTVISMIILSALFTKISNLIINIFQQFMNKRRLQVDEFIISVENSIRDDIYCVNE
ncbi:hypothetical protein HZS_1791 [Henneguya salminicola]|nr:hypothetical protein HZS_1791 [Henneguya salminicola]